MAGCRRAGAVVLVLGAWLSGAVGSALAQEPSSVPELQLFFQATVQDDDEAAAALDALTEQWRPGYTGLVWDMVRFMVPPQRPPARTAPFTRPGDPSQALPGVTAPEHPSTKVWRRLIDFLEDRTDLSLGRGYPDLMRIQEWMWAQPYEPHPDYATFKGLWYGEIDPGFRRFFPPGAAATIRLDEIDWGGVPVNGIPPLEYPPHVDADSEDAEYLDDDDLIFGLAADGAFRAYPKRILAWHEMALDRVGDLELTIVYCTLCGTVIPYESVVDGRHIEFGTSGLLYRSNKLMFDHETSSLWNTFEGVPVVGALVGSGIALRHRSVVTTTWGEWRAMHPDTTVLSLETGYERDYGEGVAYRDYFSNDRLMFQVPHRDDRLDNKDEVVVMLPEDASGVRQPLAMSVDFLEDRPVFQTEHAGRSYVVITSREGANRVYETAGQAFRDELEDGRVRASDGSVWRVGEDALELEARESAGDAGATRLPRVAAQRAFWFGWYAQFPTTRLIED